MWLKLEGLFFSMRRTIHLCHPFLPRSETFVYERALRVGPEPVVLSDEPRQNADLFPHPCVFSLCDLPWVKERYNRLMARLHRPYPDYLRLIRQHQALALVAHHGPVAAWAVPLSQAAGVPLVACFYGIDASAFLKEPRWREPYRKLFEHAALVVVLSRQMGQRLMAAGCPPEKIFENHLARNPADFDPQPRPAHGGALRVLAVGRLVAKKGFDDLIEALGQLKAGGTAFQLTLVGEGPEIVKLEQRWLGLKMQKEVNWLGALDSAGVRRWMQWCDVLAVPSKIGPDGDEEGTPTVIVEGGLMACALLSTHHAGIPDMLRHDMDALLVNEADPAALAAALSRLAGDAALRERLGASARERMLADYNAPVEAARLQTRLEALCGG